MMIMMLRRVMLRRKTDPKTGKHTLCGPRAVEMHMDMSKEAFCAEIYRENAGRESHGKHFVRACAIEMHIDMSEERLCAEIYRENAGRF